MHKECAAPPPRQSRRRIALQILALFWLAAAGVAPLHAADFPEKSVKIVVNFPPGGPLDVIARQVANRLTTTLKQSVVVENVSGAAGSIGATQVARANPDGYTILMSIDTPFTITPALYPDTSVKGEELRPVAVMGVSGSVVAVHPSLGLNSFKELVERGKREMLTFSTAGSGSPGHFAALMLADATGMKINPIHYRGNAPAVLALVSGEVQAGILATGGLLPHIKAGKLKALAVAGNTRSSGLPDLPTALEQGQAGLDLEFMFIAMVPARTPDAVVSVLHKAIMEATGQADFQERMRGLDVAPSNLAVAAAAERLSKSRERYAFIVKSTGLKGE
ncbi:MAG: tripartite tricarboxylate transporter substrate binding protein [Burkholderiaceae bacterium]